MMLNLRLWLNKRVTRRIRLVIAVLAIPIILFSMIVVLSGLMPRFTMTLGGRFSFRTPPGFIMNNMYTLSLEDPSELPVSSGRDISTSLMEIKEIPFPYPEVILAGGPLFLYSEIVHNVDFSLDNTPASGLIQTWRLYDSFSRFLNATVEYGDIHYLTFHSSQSKIHGVNCVTWDYTFPSSDETIHGLEAFLDDSPFLFRMSLFVPESQYDAQTRKVFDELVRSVRIKSPSGI